MPVTDLFAASRRILGKLLGRSRRVALAASLIPLGAIGASTAKAAPVPQLPPEFPATPFSLRITDMERVPGDAEGDAFRVEFEVVNWSCCGADALMMAVNQGTTRKSGSAPYFSGSSIDADGRGGSSGGSDIGAGVYDPIAIHSGRGRGDVPNMLNDWSVADQTESYVRWDTFDTSLPFQPWDGTEVGSRLITVEWLSIPFRVDLVPGYGADGLGDSAFDGGPDPFTPSTPGGGQPDTAYESTNVLDGFVIDVDDWDEGEVFSLNWWKANLETVSGGAPYSLFSPAEFGDPFGYGIMSLVRLEPTIGSPDETLPGPVFAGNVGFDQSGNSFFDTVYEIPNPAEFAAEFGAALTAEFVNPADNLFNLPINADRLVPEPAMFVLAGAGLFGIGGNSSRNRRNPRIVH
jgi:hypothetical protein